MICCCCTDCLVSCPIFTSFKKYNKRCYLLSCYKQPHSACSTTSIENYIWVSSIIYKIKQSWGFQLFCKYCWNISVSFEDPPIELHKGEEKTLIENGFTRNYEIELFYSSIWYSLWFQWMMDKGNAESDGWNEWAGIYCFLVKE